MSKPQLSESGKNSNLKTEKQEISEVSDDPRSLVVPKVNHNSLSVNSQRAQPFSSMDQNRTDTKNQDFEAGSQKHPHMLHIVKISSSQDVMDCPIQPNFHKTHSQHEESNEEEQNIDVASNEAQPDQSKRELSISESEGFVASKLNEKEIFDAPATEEVQQTQNLQPQALKDNFGKNKKQDEEIPQQKQIVNQKQQQNEDEQFGDFEETVPTEQKTVQKQETHAQSGQQNIVKITETYLQSSEGTFYKQKQVQLQALVDKLDDYSPFLHQADYES